MSSIYLHNLEKLLLQIKENGEPNIGTLFCKFPSNPLLKSPNSIRLRKLADQYNFLIVIDETIGNFCNVEVLPYANMLAISLTKVFSGVSNVMGGSMIINPSSKHHCTLELILDGDQSPSSGLYQHRNQYYTIFVSNTYFGEDVTFMERNLRDFQSGGSQINFNALKLCEFLSDLGLSKSNQIIKSRHTRLIGAGQGVPHKTWAPQHSQMCINWLHPKEAPGWAPQMSLGSPPLEMTKTNIPPTKNNMIVPPGMFAHMQHFIVQFGPLSLITVPLAPITNPASDSEANSGVLWGMCSFALPLLQFLTNTSFSGMAVQQEVRADDSRDHLLGQAGATSCWTAMFDDCLDRLVRGLIGLDHPRTQFMGDWGATFTVPDNLIRVLVGLEDLDTLLGWFREAFEKAYQSDH
ncbi:hypothetical protein PSTT_09262 [Puccinia striiformis]|uniref:Cystathionine beta-lyase n=1 Tax=Puccinia striiformis TaxID=27350 RepID=A0A2S4V924_9BASI|nr:hypothetical protein PSTT_09262 [Puccinia striiformis]